MRAFLTLAGGLLAIWLLFGAMPACAEATDVAMPTNLSVCNGYGDTIYLALGWQDGDGWHSQGWWTIDPGKCSTQPITAAAFYYHWESAEQTNCICPPPIANPQAKDAVMLGETEDPFTLDHADQLQGNAHLAWFNPTLFSADGASPANYTGVEKLVIAQDGSDQETLYIHQKSAIMPLP